MTSKTKSAGENGKIVEVLEYYTQLSTADFRENFGLIKPPLHSPSVSEREFNDEQIESIKKILTKIAEI